jgi:dipeptidyl aminopeptidase/acylaminoacyl peptidase
MAILAPNVRGSSGYGKSYLLLDNAEKREDSVRDIGALLDWIATRPELDAKRVVVYGGSYGGYMVLSSMTHYSDRLAAGVDIVGISNFVTFLKNTSDYRRDLRRAEYGDEREIGDFLQKISPTTNARKISKPLLVIQGKNDPRVPLSEAEQMVKTLRQSEVPVWYLMATNEGHGFRKKDNRDFMNYTVIRFLEEFVLKGK